jgi:hypothetical protein
MILFPVLPGHAVNAEQLRAHYLHSLNIYEGTTYTWGGENQQGIDCSGLVRKGFICANLKQGLLTLNGTQIREACSLWWYDSSALAMRDQYRGKTILQFKAPDINSLDHSRLLPGDIAVTESGVHTLVFIGETTWMQADPGRGAVQYEYVPVTDNGYFTMPVHILRWELLNE